LKNIFIMSASGSWKMPNGPTRFGP
jgi:hypothetical protein